MKSVEFPQVNTRLGADQPEYEMLYAHLTDGGEGFVVKFELNDDEVENVIKYRALWYHQKTFRKPFHPMYIATDKDLFSEELVNDYLPNVELHNAAEEIKLTFWQRLRLIFGGHIYKSVKVEASGYVRGVKVNVKVTVV